MKTSHNTQHASRIMLLLLIAVLALAACSPKANKLVAEGNDDYAQAEYLTALEAYQNAAIENPELAEPYYNAANALYREGDYDAALEQLQQALVYANAEQLAQAGYYNLGNALYNKQELETAVNAYRQALLINPGDADAKYNLELALQMLQQQQEQQQQEQEQQDQEQQDQQEQEQQDQQDQQQDEGDQGEEQNQDQNQNQQQNDEEGGGGEENADNEDQSKGDEGEEGEKGNDEPDDQENQSEGEDGEGDQNEDQSGQGQAGQEEEQPVGQNPGDTEGQRLTPEQARQLLAAIAQGSDTLQERLGQIFVVPNGRPPQQDW